MDEKGLSALIKLLSDNGVTLKELNYLSKDKVLYCQVHLAG